MNAQHADNLRLAEEAAEWVLRRMDDRSPECNAQFIRWLKDSPHHIDEFLLAATTYAALREGEAAQLLDIGELLEHAPSNVVQLDRAPPAADHTNKPTHPAPVGRAWWLHPTWRGFRLAAVVSALAFGLWMAWSYWDGLNTFATGVGEQRMVRLEDGSLVHLNTRSRIKVVFSDQARQLRLLEGEAFFAVAKDTARPFHVLTHDALVQAIGTEFSVYDHGDTTRISVLEGQVRVAARTADTSPAQLRAGEQANVNSNGEILRPATPDVGNALAWRDRQLIFRAAPLAAVAEEFNRYNNYQIGIEGGKLAGRAISGVFPVDDPQALVKFLAQDASIELKKTRNGVTVSPASAP